MTIVKNISFGDLNLKKNNHVPEEFLELFSIQNCFVIRSTKCAPAVAWLWSGGRGVGQLPGHP